MGSARLADLIIAVAYFLIPLEIAIFMVKRRCVGRCLACSPLQMPPTTKSID